MSTLSAPPASLADLAWRTAFRAGFPLARAWWRMWGRPHEGALVAIRVGAALLLVRSSYRAEWNFPGGGVRKGETAEDAARRELMEEIGLAAPPLRLAGVLRGFWDGRRDRVHFFDLNLPALPQLRLDNREIIAARLVPMEELPHLPLTRAVVAYLHSTAPPWPRERR